MDEAIAHCTRGHRHLGLGQQRRRRRARRGAGLRRRRAHAGDAGRGRPAARSTCPTCAVRVVNVVDLMRLQPETEHPHGLPDARVRRAVHHRPAGDLRLPRLPVADPPADLPAHQPRQPPRARLQGGGHDDDAVRHGHAQRPRPLPPGDRRDRPGARPRRTRAGALRQQMVDERLAATAPTRASTARTSPESRDWVVAASGAERPRCGSWSSTPARAA